MKKYLISLLLFIGVLFTFVPNAKAATAKMTISPSSKQILVGNSVTVTVTVSSSSPMATSQFVINGNGLTLTKSSASSGGARSLDVYMNGSTYKATYTFTFKAKKSGTYYITLDDVHVYDSNKKEYSVTKSSSKIKVMTQKELEASYSKNNNLSSLSIDGYELSPAFNKNTTEYTVKLKPETEKIKINATKEDSTATIYGTGNVEVSDGSNKLKVQVTAQNGNTKIYTITALVEELDPIEIKIDNKVYSVVRKRKSLEFNNPLFIDSETNIQGNEVHSFLNEITNTTVIGLKDEEGNISYFVKDGDNYYPYNEIKAGNISILYLDAPETPYECTESELTIGESTYKSYIEDNNSRFHLIYGINLQNGNKGFYSYDNYEDSLQRFNNEVLTKLETKEAETKKIIIIISGIAGFFFLVSMISLISNLVRGRKKHKTIKEEKVESHEPKEDKKLDKTITDEIETIKSEEKTSKKLDKTITDEIETLKSEEKTKKTKK